MFGMPPLLDDEMILRCISLLPSNITKIIEVSNIDIKKFISKSSGLIQTRPLLKAYDLSETDRKIIIDYAVSRQQEMADKEEKYLEIFEKEIDNGDYSFMDILSLIKFRIEFREYEKESIRKDLEFTS